MKALTDSGGHCASGCVHTTNGVCRDCGHVAVLVCRRCTRAITAAEYDNVELCAACEVVSDAETRAIMDAHRSGDTEAMVRAVAAAYPTLEWPRAGAVSPMREAEA